MGDVVGIWLFDEGKGEVAGDSSGNGNDGTILPDVKWTKNGKFGSALDFPGSVTATSYVVIPNNPSLDLVEHSMTAWIKVTPTQDNWQIIVCKWDPHTVRNYSLLTNLDTGIGFAQLTSGGEKQYKTAMGQTAMTDDEWHHLAGTYDGSIMKVYINGVMEAQIATGDPDTNPGDLTIGARWGGTHPTTGIIDDVGLFSVGLEEDEIKDIMTNGLQEAFSLTAVDALDKLATTWGKIKIY